MVRGGVFIHDLCIHDVCIQDSVEIDPVADPLTPFGLRFRSRRVLKGSLSRTIGTGCGGAPGRLRTCSTDKDTDGSWPLGWANDHIAQGGRIIDHGAVSAPAWSHPNGSLSSARNLRHNSSLVRGW
jgi:hypothetical protein